MQKKRLLSVAQLVSPPVWIFRTKQTKTFITEQHEISTMDETEISGGISCQQKQSALRSKSKVILNNTSTRHSDRPHDLMCLSIIICSDVNILLE